MNEKVPYVELLPKEERRILRGHLWVYKNEINSTRSFNDGEIIDIYSSSHKYVGRAFYQSTGTIFARILSSHQEDIDEQFFKKRLNAAWVIRNRIFPSTNVYRWIHAEADGLPGLIIDRYGDTIVLDTQCGFYEQKQNKLVSALFTFPGINRIILKHLSQVIPNQDVPESIPCTINGIQCYVPIKKGQKTGLFLDQRLNYLHSMKYIKECSVLDCFSYIGIWSCHCIQGGAKQVTAIDSSEYALDIAKKNIELNGYSDKVELVHTEIEKYLQQCQLFDVIILDPPAYVKKKEDLQKGMAKYQKIITMALKKLNPNGILISCSCSHFLTPSLFKEVIKRSLRQTGRKARLLEFHGASPDHPELLMMPELSYLKCAILSVS